MLERYPFAADFDRLIPAKTLCRDWQPRPVWSSQWRELTDWSPSWTSNVNQEKILLWNKVIISATFGVGRKWDLVMALFMSLLYVVSLWIIFEWNFPLRKPQPRLNTLQLAKLILRSISLFYLYHILGDSQYVLDVFTCSRTQNSLLTFKDS